MWNCPSVNATRSRWIVVNIGTSNGLVLSGNKLLSEPKLTQISVLIWHQYTTVSKPNSSNSSNYCLRVIEYHGHIWKVPISAAWLWWHSTFQLCMWLKESLARFEMFLTEKPTNYAEVNNIPEKYSLKPQCHFNSGSVTAHYGKLKWTISRSEYHLPWEHNGGAGLQQPAILLQLQ